MAQKVLSEAQMREYVEQEVRMALMNESVGNNILSESINEALEENMTDENVLDFLKNLTGIGNGQGVSLEGIIMAILGHNFVPNLLGKLLNAIGIPTDQALGQWILKRVGEIGGYSLGQWLDRKYDLIGFDNIFKGRQPQQPVTGTQN